MGDVTFTTDEQLAAGAIDTPINCEYGEDSGYESEGMSGAEDSDAEAEVEAPGRILLGCLAECRSGALRAPFSSIALAPLT